MKPAAFFIEPKLNPGHVELCAQILKRQHGPWILCAPSEVADILRPACHARLCQLSSDMALPVRWFLTLINHVISLRKAARSGAPVVIFLSYHTVALYLASRIIRPAAPVFAYNHYNIDDAEDSFPKRRMMQALAKRISFLNFESYISHHMSGSYGATCRTAPHPVRDIDPVIMPDPHFIFAPSRSPDPSFMAHLRDFASSHRLRIRCRPFEGADPQDALFTIEDHFSDYDALIASCRFVAIPRRYQYRVSGVFYEALQAGKTVLMPNCLFATEMQKAHRNVIILGSDHAGVS